MIFTYRLKPRVNAAGVDLLLITARRSLRRIRSRRSPRSAGMALQHVVNKCRARRRSYKPSHQTFGAGSARGDEMEGLADALRRDVGRNGLGTSLCLPRGPPPPCGGRSQPGSRKTTGFSVRCTAHQRLRSRRGVRFARSHVQVTCVIELIISVA